MRHHTLAALVVIAMALVGCDDKPATNTDNAGQDQRQVTSDQHKPGSSSGGKVIALGDGEFGAFKLKATRDEGEIKTGGDAPIDVWVDPAASSSPLKVVGVRFWIGSEDAKGSVKAKAEIEDPKEPNRWHTHAEVPDPTPAGAKLWVEIEDDGGKLTLASFDLKT